MFKKILLYLFFVLCIIRINCDVVAKTYSVKVSKEYTTAENLIELGKYHEAESYLIKLLQKNPNDISARNYLAEVHSAQYKLDGAEKEFLQILEIDPKNAMAHNGLGVLNYRRTTSSDMSIRENIDKYYSAAMQEFTLAVKSDPGFYKSYNNAGKILFELGRLVEAEKYFAKSIEIKPDYSEGVENYGRLLFAKNQIDAAIDKYRESLRLNSKNSSAYCNLGEALIRKGDYSAAIKQLQTSLYLFPNSAPVHDLLGRAYELQGNEAAAISEYRKSFLIKPEYLPPYLRLAEVYRNRGDDEIAISELRNALSINPDFYEAKIKIADTSLNIGKHNQAVKYYKELLEVPKYKMPAIKGLSKAYFIKAKDINSRGAFSSEADYVELENTLKQAIENDPENMELYLALLRVSKVSNKDKQAESYMKNLLENPKNTKMVHIIKGETYLTCSDFNNAEREFLVAINQTTDKDDLIKLAEIYTMNRAYKSAKAALSKVQSIDPANIKAKRILQRIKRNEDESVSKTNIAEAFYNEKQMRAAIEAYHDALAMNSYLPEAHLGLAKAFEKQKFYYDSVDHYTAYINLIDVSFMDEREKYLRKIESLKRKIAGIEARKQFIKKYIYY